MPNSKINADSGAISGTSGLKTTGGDTGILEIQNNGTTSVTLDASGNVGVGTSSPATKLHVKDGTVSIENTSGYGVIEMGGSSGAFLDMKNPFSDDYDFRMQTDGSTAFLITAGSIPMTFQTNNSERARIDSSGNLLVGKTSATANGGVLQVSNGITFPATQSACSDVNTLDDYEEGTWTPTMYGATSAGTTTYVSQAGRYTKIGNVVTASGYLNWSNATGTGSMRIGGLPFTSLNVSNIYHAASIGYAGNLTTPANTVPSFYLDPNATILICYGITVGGGAAQAIAIDTSAEIIFTITYLTST